MNIIWTEPASLDLDGIWNYHLIRSLSAAVETNDVILVAVSRLANFPNLGRPGRQKGTRELVISGTPYIVIYKVASPDLAILRVLHGAQKWPPGRRRKPSSEGPSGRP